MIVKVVLSHQRLGPYMKLEPFYHLGAWGLQTELFRQGIIHHALLSEDHLEGWISQFVRYQHVLNPFLKIHREASGADICLHIEPINPSGENDPKTSFRLVKNWLVDWARWGSIFHEGKPSFTRVDLSFSVPDFDTQCSLSSIVGCQVRFGCEKTCVFIPYEILGTPLILPPFVEREYELKIGNRILDKLNPTTKLTDLIYRDVVKFHGLIPSMEVVAARCFKSVRTLHRHLKKEGASYQRLVINYRLAVAKCYLLETLLPIDEVSSLIGYSDVANFYRAFKAAEGVTPHKYRKQMHLKSLELYVD